MAEVALAAGMACGAGIAFRYLTVLHPASLWLAAWAVATALFAIKALPYRPLSDTTLLLVAGWTALFCAGTLLGSRLLSRFLARHGAAGTSAGMNVVAPAAAIAVAATVVVLAAFLLQVASLYGIRSAIISDAYVRLGIGEGATPYTIKYVYFGFAAAALTGLAAGRAQSARARRLWIVIALAMIASQYFSTGRSNILLAALMACVAYFLGRPDMISPKRLLLAAAGIGAAMIVIFLGMGSLLDKGFATSDMRTYDNTFSRNESLAPVALPYQYVTATIPAFDVVREVTPTTGRGGCMTLSAACSIGARLGLPVEPEPSLTGFTGEPNPWNTFTALYAPLVDGGPIFGTLIIFVQGALFGLLWAAARHGSAYAVTTYAAMSSAVAYSTVENTLLQPHLIGAALIAVTVTAAAVKLEPLASLRGRVNA